MHRISSGVGFRGGHSLGFSQLHKSFYVHFRVDAEIRRWKHICRMSWDIENIQHEAVKAAVSVPTQRAATWLVAATTLTTI